MPFLFFGFEGGALLALLLDSALAFLVELGVEGVVGGAEGGLTITSGLVECVELSAQLGTLVEELSARTGLLVLFGWIASSSALISS